jgi:hypothetical protein
MCAAFVCGSHDRWPQCFREALTRIRDATALPTQSQSKWHLPAVQPPGDDGFSMATDKRAAALVTETDLHSRGREAPSFVRRFRRLAAPWFSSNEASGRCLRTEHPFAA